MADEHLTDLKKVSYSGTGPHLSGQRAPQSLPWPGFAMPISTSGSEYDKREEFAVALRGPYRTSLGRVLLASPFTQSTCVSLQCGRLLPSPLDPPVSRSAELHIPGRLRGSVW